VLPAAAPPPAGRPGQILVILGVVVAVLVGLGGVGFAIDKSIGHDNSAAAPPPIQLALPQVPVTSPSPATHVGSVRSATMSANRTSDGTVVNTALAKQILHRYWPVHEHALVDRDLPALRRMSAGPARRWEQASVSCGCLAVQSARPLLTAAYFVPRQTTYPASFVTEAQTQADGVYWAELLVFTKHAAGAPWRVTEDSGFGPPPGVAPQLGTPINDSQGYDEPVPTWQRDRARQVAARFANVWQRAKDTGRIPRHTGFELDGANSRTAEIASHRQGRIQANGLIGHFRFSTSRREPLVDVTDSERTLACEPILETVHYTAPPGRSILQDSARLNWGPRVPPGDYQHLTSTDVWQTCFLIPATDQQRIEILDQDIGGALATVPKREVDNSTV
jgi:hypothetical protein